MARKIYISALSDLVSDQRVHKTAMVLQDMGFDVSVLGVVWPNSKKLVKKSYKSQRFKLLFTTGPLMYLNFNLGLFFYFLCRPAGIYFSNDLDTLLPNFIVSKLKRKPLVYDSHELFTELPELTSRPSKQKMWLKLEAWLLPKVKLSFTVCQSIADFYKSKYGIVMHVVRNVPFIKSTLKQNKPKELESIPRRNKIILYQGWLNMGRGLNLMIEAMQFVDNATLVICGDGYIKQDLEQLCEKIKVCDKVIFTGKIPFEQLSAYTQYANLGLSLEENLGLNYYYALPNKLFDYIHAGVPVLVSSFPEMRKIVEQYQVGETFDGKTAEELAKKIDKMLNSEKKLEDYKFNICKAVSELNWEKESEVIQEELSRFVGTV
ncbi:glycosyltransferase [Bacteroidales bacterium]|nr:glycosyltransferase [Bacteroidales bacterium]